MVAGIAAIFSVIGSVAGIVGSFMQYSASKKAEAARQRQMLLESQRQKREILRRAQVQRAQALAAGTNQGANNSSALAGGMASVTSSAGRNINAVNQDTELSNRIFSANKQAALGGLIANLGGGLSSLGGAVSQTSGVITRFGQSGVNVPFLKKKREQQSFMYG